MQWTYLSFTGMTVGLWMCCQHVVPQPIIHPTHAVSAEEINGTRVFCLPRDLHCSSPGTRFCMWNSTLPIWVAGQKVGLSAWKEALGYCHGEWALLTWYWNLSRWKGNGSLKHHEAASQEKWGVSIYISKELYGPVGKQYHREKFASFSSPSLNLYYFLFRDIHLPSGKAPGLGPSGPWGQIPAQKSEKQLVLRPKLSTTGGRMPWH